MRPAGLRQGIVALVGAALVAVTPPSHALVWPDVPEKLERDLGSVDPVVRRGATETLETLGPTRAAPLVLRALADTDPGVRFAAAEAAVHARIAGATSLVLPWLGEHDARLRIAACEVARALPDPRAVAPLARALSDADAEVRRAAAEALGAQEKANALAPLLGKLDDASPTVRMEIARALGRLGDAKAVVPLIGKVEDSVPDVRQAVAHALGELGDPRAVPAIVLQLRDTLADVRVSALAALGRLKGADAVDAIAPIVTERNTEVRHAALAALGRIGSPAAITALVGRLGLDDDNGSGLDRTPVRDALLKAGSAAVTPLRAVLERTGSPASAASAAWVLGELGAKESEHDIEHALRRGSLPAAAALHALVGAGLPDAMSLVLEFVDDENPQVRSEAFDAAKALLDPAHPDGRAVEPLLAAAEGPRLRSADKVKLIGLLGRTGAARAAPLLSGLLTSHDAAIKLAAVDALGALGPTHSDEALLSLMNDLTNAELRLHAAVALASSGSAVARDAILTSLDQGKELDRGAAWHALGGILTREPSERAWKRLALSLDVAAGGERDAILLVMGRAAPVHPVLENLIKTGDADDRRTIASACGARADASPLLRSLLLDHDASVRAAAAWSLGESGAPDALPLLLPLTTSPDRDVAVNAAAAIGRVSARGPEAGRQAALCALLTSKVPLVQANALTGLALGHTRCVDGAPERALLKAPFDEVRVGAARAVGAKRVTPEDSLALARCAGDRLGEVAALCRKLLVAAEQAPPPGPTHPALVYVEAGTQNEPRPLSPYVALLADGMLRLGETDRRGAFFDPAAPDGEVRLQATGLPPAYSAR